MRSYRGLTIVEILVALAVLAAAVMGAASLQGTALRANSQAEILNQLARAASGEVEWRRQTAIVPSSVGTSDCESTMPASIAACEVVVTPCALPPGESRFICTNTVVSPIAYELVVRLSSGRGQRFELRSVNTGLYFVSGTGGTVGARPWQFPSDEEGGDPDDAPITP